MSKKKRVTGVSWSGPNTQRWQVRVNGGGITFTLGRFKDHDEAVAVLMRFRAKYGHLLNWFAEIEEVSKAVKQFKKDGLK